MSNRLNRPAILVHGIEEMEDLDDQIAELKERIKGIKGHRKGTMAELKAEGFDSKCVEQMIRERKMDADSRRLYQAQLQVYRAMIGMLDGTPLGEAARQAFEEEARSHRRKQNEEDQPPEDGETTSRKGRRKARPDQAQPAPSILEAASLPTPRVITPEQIAEARAAGVAAAQNGQSVTDNPYPASQQELRAAFDEGWCSELGSDGMEIPAAFRRPDKSEKPSDDENQGGKE